MPTAPSLWPCGLLFLRAVSGDGAATGFGGELVRLLAVKEVSPLHLLIISPGAPASLLVASAFLAVLPASTTAASTSTTAAWASTAAAELGGLAIYLVLGCARRRWISVELGLAGRVFLCGWLFRATSARRWCRRRRGITSPGLFLAPAAFHSGANGGVVEICTGVRARRFIVLVR